MSSINNRGSLAIFLAPTVWLAGAFASCVVGLAVDAPTGWLVLAAMAALTLLLARRAIGWRAVPVVATLAALQTPILVQVGVAETWHTASPWQWSTQHEVGLAVTVLAAILLASPMAFLMQLEGVGLARLRRLARFGAPAALCLCAPLAVLGAAAVARFPTQDAYIASLPVYAVIPGPKEQPCEPLVSHNPEHADIDAVCVTPEVEAAPLSFHYHHETYRPGEGLYLLKVRHAGGEERTMAHFFEHKRPEMPSSLTLLYDAEQEAWLLNDGRTHDFFTAKEREWWGSYVYRIRDRVAPPLGWLLLGIGGILAALGCAAAWLGAKRFVQINKPGHSEWLGALRGDLSLVAFAALLCSNALLFAALLSGYMV